jgi:hypothetical protein
VLFFSYFFPKTMCNQAALTVSLALCALALFGCEEFATPAELSRPQILGIAAEPPAVAPGETAALAILVADPDGPIEAPDVRWEVVPALPGSPALGEVRVRDDGHTEYVGPPQLPSGVTPVAAVQATVTVAGQELLAIKAIGLGPLPLANPTLAALTADGVEVPAGEPLATRPALEVELSAAIEPAADEDTTWTWYSNVAAIERYRANPTVLAAPPWPESGWLFVVVRDGRGGVTWRSVELHIE